jgi:predicted metal-dependent hydrolase
MEKTIHHPVIGAISIKKKIGNRNIRITVHPIRGVNVSIPWLTRYSSAERFIFEREEWIISTIQKQKSKREKSEVPLGEGEHFHTFLREIEFCQTGQENLFDAAGKNGKIKIILKKGVGVIHYPQGATRQELVGAIEKILRYDAKEYLPARTAELAKKFGFCYNNIYLKNNKTNWGSCSRLNNINLNIHLMRLSAEIADYVILHELCHLKHRNHGSDFHKMLNNLCEGKEKQYSKQLRSFRTSL